MLPILDNTVENVNGKLRSTKSRCKKEKTKDIIDFHRSLEELNTITYASVLNLPKCQGMVPQRRGTAGLFGPFRRCDRHVRYPGQTLCNLHYIDKKTALNNGAYKQIWNGAAFVQDDNRNLKIEWSPTDGDGLYIRSGQKDQLVTWYDGKFHQYARDCRKYYT